MLVRSLVLGVAAAIAALIFATLSSGSGVRLNTDAWPPSAKAILIEQPGQPISIEQWRRIETALDDAGNNSTPSHLIAAEVRRTWPVVLVAAAIALFIARWFIKPITFAATSVLLAPSALLLAAAFVHTHAYYQ